MRIGAVMTAALLSLTLSAPAAATTREPDHPPRQAAPAFDRAVLTPDGTTYRFARRAGGRVVISAPAVNQDWNRREVFHERGARSSRDQTTCATWARQSGGMVQEGLAVRIVDRAGRVRAITLTKNTLFRLHWVFNLLTWDTARRGDPWRRVRQFDMSGVVGQSAKHLAPLPWRVCLRATGRTVAFKVWLPRRTGTPSWDDPVHARQARLPRGFAAAGAPGWYVGHVPPGGEVVYRGLTTR